jgi:hypothetical protein
MLSTGEAYAAISGRSIASRLFHRGLPDATITVRLALVAGAGWRIEAIFAGLHYQRSLEQLNFLDFKSDQVLYICNSRGRPGCTLGFLFFRPGAHGPTQDRLRAPHVNGDPAGV